MAIWLEQTSEGGFLMTTRVTGGCMCGAVRYECGADPIAMGNCHCRDCQRATGSAFAAAVLVPTSTVNIRGEVKYTKSSEIAALSSVVAFVRIAAPGYSVSRPRRRTSWALWPVALMIRAGTALKQTSTPPARSRGTI